jgi:nucleoside-diphosphate-sugar epimerase
MKILVTGGVGFIGHNIVAKFEQQGHEVCVLDNFTNYGIVPEREITALHQERLDQIQTKSIHHVDIRNFSAVMNVFSECRPDVVVHCAAFPRAKVVDENPEDGAAVLTGGLINLLRASEYHKVRRFVYVSSSMVYGDFNLMGYEDMPCTPKGTYGILKLAGESLTRDACVRAGIDCVILRPSAVYGPRDVLDRVVSRFLTAAMRDQELVVCGASEVLDFTYVDDCVDGIVRATHSFNSSQRTYNITRSSGRTLLEAAELAVSIVGQGRIRVAEANPRFPSRGTLSTTRAGQDFGYRGQVNIEQGFQQYYEWLQSSFFWNNPSVSRS